MIPDSNNVYGQIEAPNGLEPIRFALASWLGSSAVSIYKSSYDGSESIRLRTTRAEFASTPLKNGCHLLNGCVEGNLTTIESFIANLSRHLEWIGVKHSFEIHDDN
jgi:hypothetical protein